MGAPPAPMTPQFTQEQLATQADTVTLSGTIVCESGKGPFIIHIFPPPPSDPTATQGDQKPPGPITEQKVAEVGAFSLKVPKGDDALLLGFNDANADGMPGPEEGIFFYNGAKPIARSADLADLKLDCSAVATPPADGVPSGPPPGAEGGPTAPPGGATGAAPAEGATK